MKCSSGWSGLYGAVVTLACGVLVVACSQAPPEPAPEFTLPLSEVTATPPAQGGASAAEPAAPSRLRYIAVPPGEKVGGMAHARIVLKRSKRNAHRPRHVHKRAVAPAAVITKPTENDGPAAKPRLCSRHAEVVGEDAARLAPHKSTEAIGRWLRSNARDSNS